MLQFTVCCIRGEILQQVTLAECRSQCSISKDDGSVAHNYITLSLRIKGLIDWCREPRCV